MMVVEVVITVLVMIVLMMVVIVVVIVVVVVVVVHAQRWVGRVIPYNWFLSYANVDAYNPPLSTLFSFPLRQRHPSSETPTELTHPSPQESWQLSEDQHSSGIIVITSGP